MFLLSSILKCLGIFKGRPKVINPDRQLKMAYQNSNEYEPEQMREIMRTRLCNVLVLLVTLLVSICLAVNRKRYLFLRLLKTFVPIERWCRRNYNTTVEECVIIQAASRSVTFIILYRFLICLLGFIYDPNDVMETIDKLFIQIGAPLGMVYTSHRVGFSVFEKAGTVMCFLIVPLLFIQSVYFIDLVYKLEESFIKKEGFAKDFSVAAMRVIGAVLLILTVVSGVYMISISRNGTEHTKALLLGFMIFVSVLLSALSKDTSVLTASTVSLYAMWLYYLSWASNESISMTHRRIRFWSSLIGWFVDLLYLFYRDRNLGRPEAKYQPWNLAQLPLSAFLCVICLDWFQNPTAVWKTDDALLHQEFKSYKSDRIPSSILYFGGSLLGIFLYIWTIVAPYILTTRKFSN